MLIDVSGREAMETVYLINNESTPFPFHFVEDSLHSEGYASHLIVEPKSGSIPAKSRYNVALDDSHSLFVSLCLYQSLYLSLYLSLFCSLLIFPLHSNEINGSIWLTSQMRLILVSLNSVASAADKVQKEV